MRPFDGEESWGIPWPVDNMGVPAGSHATPSQKKRLGKERRQQSDAKVLPEGRTLMMMMMTIDTFCNMKLRLKVLQIIVSLTAI